MVLVDIVNAHPPSDRRYAASLLTVSNNYHGIKGDLETAIPSVSDGGFSSEVMCVSPGGNPKTVEVGWRTRPSPYQNPKWYSGFFDSSGNWTLNWEGNPAVGVAYAYKIEKNSSGNWDIHINGTFKRAYNSGMTAGNRIIAGGAVTKFSSSVDNAMGVSGFLNMKYKKASDGVWYPWTNLTNLHVDSGNGYTLVSVGGSNSDFQTHGNNP